MALLLASALPFTKEAGAHRELMSVVLLGCLDDCSVILRSLLIS